MLDHKNPDDWGKSPLTDRALRLAQFKDENPEKWEEIIDAEIQARQQSLKEDNQENEDND